ncbi:TIGR02391 family protein [Streptomyces sp. NBC_01296]|uniref:TIGR02391 family protein n=1 Tax=Streptomyces sp. NBC_01296 TaxID=2903816 RepID=UPI002E116CCD|nr:TIGR02391 family protein [Streptomyces sp. NBC_01296]WSN53433.1 TIGR02391 family protein [Streptomyces sp. NBC_01296]
MAISIADIAWARAELARFLELTTLYHPPDPPGVTFITSRMSNRGDQKDILASAQVVEQILDRVLPGWRTEIPDSRVNRWCRHREAAQRAEAVLERDGEVRARLGDDAPDLNASAMHPWAWEGARPLWQSGHFREAVTAAARKVNAETQNKVGRKDVSETRLFQQAFSQDDPKPGQPRLRLMDNDGSDTFRSVHRGAAAFTEGFFAGIRNPNSHDDGLPELPQHEALEQLAALSVLALWVDTAALVTA